jgi:hypothetical protein
LDVVSGLDIFFLNQAPKLFLAEESLTVFICHLLPLLLFPILLDSLWERTEAQIILQTPFLGVQLHFTTGL